MAEGVGLGVELGVGLGDGVGTGVAVEPEALTAPPPQPATLKRREKNRTQPMTFGPMGNDLLHTATLDATELLDVVLVPCFSTGELTKSKTGPLRGPVLLVGYSMEVLLEKFSHGGRNGRCTGHVIDIQQLQHRMK